MDVKSINTAGWREPKKGSVLQKVMSDEEEIDTLRESIYASNPQSNNKTSHSVTTIEWISTWRKITTNS